MLAFTSGCLSTQRVRLISRNQSEAGSFDLHWTRFLVLKMSSLPQPPPPPSSPPPREAYARARALLAKVEKPIMRSWDAVRRSGKAGLIPIPRSVPLAKRKSSSVPANFDFSPQHEETLKTIFHLLSNGSFVA